MLGLTKQQRELLNYLTVCLAETGVPPSFDEMKDHLRLRSKSGVHRLIVALEERGHIQRIPNRARAIGVMADGAISLRLPVELDNRLRLVAGTLGITPEHYIIGLVRDRLAVATDARPLEAA